MLQPKRTLNMAESTQAQTQASGNGSACSPATSMTSWHVARLHPMTSWHVSMRSRNLIGGNRGDRQNTRGTRTRPWPISIHVPHRRSIHAPQCFDLSLCPIIHRGLPSCLFFLHFLSLSFGAGLSLQPTDR